MRQGFLSAGPLAGLQPEHVLKQIKRLPALFSIVHALLQDIQPMGHQSALRRVGALNNTRAVTKHVHTAAESGAQKISQLLRTID